MDLRTDLRPVVDALLALPRQVLTLDDLADAIGTHAVTAQEIDGIMRAVERAGRRIDSPEPGEVSEDLGRVIQTAKMLSAELGRRPTPEEIATRAGLTASAVRGALLYARVLSRS
jgi:hypothetical protein